MNNAVYYTAILCLGVCVCIIYRDRSSLAITGEGLAMAGVGYDLQSLAIPKFGTTTTNPKKLKKKAEKRAMMISMEKEEKERNEMSVMEERKRMKVAD